MDKDKDFPDGTFNMGKFVVTKLEREAIKAAEKRGAEKMLKLLDDLVFSRYEKKLYDMENPAIWQEWEKLK